MKKNNFIKTLAQPSYVTIFVDVTYDSESKVVRMNVTDTDKTLVELLTVIADEKGINQIKEFVEEIIIPDHHEMFYDWLLKELDLEIE